MGSLWEVRITSTFLHCVHFLPSSMPLENKLFVFALSFDSSLGYPGEGPNLWTGIFANADSFPANTGILSFEADAYFLQEARVSTANHIDCLRKAQSFGFSLFCSQLLHPIQQRSGYCKVPYGGTATICSGATTQLFDPSSDETRLWATLTSTTRVTASWHQVSRDAELLVINFYAASAANEKATFDYNNDLLSNLFTIVHQFGDTPVIICGDFQAEPGLYPAVQTAIDYFGWTDPLLGVDENGAVARPPTFFQHADATWENGATSIDGVLFNRTALVALQSIEILQDFDRQRASVLEKPASLLLDDVVLPQINDSMCPLIEWASDQWHTNVQSRFHACSSPDDKLRCANEFAIDYLVRAGAKWGPGRRARGTPPRFRTKCVYPGQTIHGDPLSAKISSLRKALTLQEK